MNAATVAVRNVPRWMLWLPVDPLVLDRWGGLWPVPALAYAGKWLLLRPVKSAVAGLALWLAVAGTWWLGLFPVLLAVGIDRWIGAGGAAASGRLARSYRSSQARGRVRRHWAAYLRTAGIVGATGRVPRHGWIRRTDDGLRVLVRHGKAGVSESDIIDGLEVLTGLVGGLYSIRWRSGGPDAGMLYINLRNPLATLIPHRLLPVAGFGKACLGKAAEGYWFTLTLLGRHILLTGQTGAGKSSVLWTLIAAAEKWSTPPQWWVMDPKMGVELAAMDPDLGGVATRYSRDSRELDAMAQQLYEEAQRRGAIMRANGWKAWRPAYEDELGPLIFFLIDELLSLGPKATGPKSYLRRLLQEARAMGIYVIGCTQLPQTDSSALGRIAQLFNCRIVGSTAGPGMTSSALGDHAVTEAPAHKLVLPADAGIFFVLEEGRSGYAKIKAGYLDDESGEHLPVARGELRKPEGLGETLADVIEEAA